MLQWFPFKRLLHPASARHSGRHDHARELLSSLLVMAWLVEARDPYTGGHLWRVSRYAELLAEAADLADADVARISIGGFLHDLGKIGIPDAVLRKPAPLTDTEFETMRTHPEAGMRMLAGHPLAAEVRPAILFHHERPDGDGYPQGLAGDAIPIDARIVGLCDAFDAMTSSRPYRRGIPVDAALARIRENLGAQFDHRFGTLFLELGTTGTLAHVAGHSDDGIPLRDCVVCGPTLVVRREDRAGDHLYCRNCGGEYALHAAASGDLQAEPTGRVGSAKQLVAEADSALIARLVQETARRISLPRLLEGVPA